MGPTTQGDDTTKLINKTKQNKDIGPFKVQYTVLSTVQIVSKVQ